MRPCGENTLTALPPENIKVIAGVGPLQEGSEVEGSSQRHQGAVGDSGSSLAYQSDLEGQKN